MKATAQAYADDMLAPEFKQPLKTVLQACEVHGWDADTPTCCGSRVVVRDFIGSPYFAECKTCGRFVLDVTGPRFGNGHVRTIDTELVDVSSDKLWIAGQQPEVEIDELPH